uniref:Uncharacterized protein n=1 Tax=Amphimedon queenslandica TaxID=400682 RepID=A0A1X7UKH6_AMPQE
MMRAGGPAATTRIKCEKVANTIVTQYPFLADPYGKSRSSSWKLKLIECINNIEKYERQKEKKQGIETPKSSTKGKGKARRSLGITAVTEMTIVGENEESLLDAIASEMKNEVVRIDVLKPLMSATFNSRRLKIVQLPIRHVVEI